MLCVYFLVFVFEVLGYIRLSNCWFVRALSTAWVKLLWKCYLLMVLKVSNCDVFVVSIRNFKKYINLCRSLRAELLTPDLPNLKQNFEPLHCDLLLLNCELCEKILEISLVLKILGLLLLSLVWTSNSKKWSIRFSSLRTSVWMQWICSRRLTVLYSFSMLNVL
jgi:hypothetical protein